jgi:hypothetical protein
MFRCRAYGLEFKSAYPLAPGDGGLREAFASGADVELVRGTARDFSSIHRTVNGGSRGEPWFQYARLADGRDYVRWPKLFEFLIAQDGRRIIGHPLHPVSWETFQTYLLGHVLSFALLRLGLEPLHGTTVVAGENAIAFLGDCGYGKSTLAAACLGAGFSLLTDDLLVLKREGARDVAYPGLPRIKLMPWVARWLMGPRPAGARMNPFTSKLIIPLRRDQYASAPAPLKAIYTLRPSRRPRRSRVVIRQLSTRAAWQELTKGTFNLDVYDPARLRRHFEWASCLAGRIPVKSLSYPRSLRALPGVVEALVSDVTS